MLNSKSAKAPSVDEIRQEFNQFFEANDESWRSYYYERPIEFITNFFFTYDTEQLLTLHPSQENPLREALRRDENGDYVYHTVVWSWMKKAAKSTIIAAVCDWYAMVKPKASIKLIGNDLKQSDSRVGHYMRENIKIGVRKLVGSQAKYAEHILKARVNTRIKTSNYEIFYPGGSKVEMIPIDPSGEAGGNDDITVFSELWGWKNKAHQDMYAEMTISPTRFGKAQRWIDTYAGFVGASPILEDLYETIVKQGERLDVEGNDECYSNDGFFATWVTKHHLPWQTKEYYASERKALTDNQYKRLHLNQWVTAEESFIDIDLWDNAVDTRPPDEDGIPPMRPNEPLILALDAGIKSDCFAIVGITRDPRFQATYRYDHDTDNYEFRAEERFVLRYANAWQGSKENPLKFYSDNPDDITPESELKRLIATYNVIQVTYDPYQLSNFCNRLEDETGAWFDEFTQGGEREIGDKLLYDVIKNGGMAHHGAHRQMRTHLMNAGAKSLSDDRKLRIIKLSEKAKIDLVVAMAMGTKRASDEIPK